MCHLKELLCRGAQDPRTLPHDAIQCHQTAAEEAEEFLQESGSETRSGSGRRQAEGDQRITRRPKESEAAYPEWIGCENQHYEW